MGLASLHVGAMVPVSDLETSRAFYEETLGLEGTPVPGGHLLRAGNGTTIYLLPVADYAGKAEWPLVSFRSHDLEDTVADLQARGVELERIADGPQKTDARGIAELDGMWIAWIRDPDRQVISIFQTME